MGLSSRTTARHLNRFRGVENIGRILTITYNGFSYIQSLYKARIIKLGYIGRGYFFLPPKRNNRENFPI
jgi:hypothetical protein